MRWFLMNNATMRNLSKLAKCLEDASLCIDQLPAIGLITLQPQLLSLKLILDSNAEALRLRIADLKELSKPSAKKRVAAKT